MPLRNKPKLVITSLAAGTLVLVAGGALAATLPSATRHGDAAGAAVRVPAVSSARQNSGAPTGAPATAPSAIPAPSSGSRTTQHGLPSPKATGGGQMHADAKRATASATYVVRTGDTLSGVAAWFKLHGFGDLYAANRNVIGSNPDLIRPGERISISGDGVMTMKAPA